MCSQNLVKLLLLTLFFSFSAMLSSRSISADWLLFRTNTDPSPNLQTTDVNLTACARELITFYVQDSTAGSSYEFFVAGMSVQHSAQATYKTSTLSSGQLVAVRETDILGFQGKSSGITFTINACDSPEVMINKYYNAGGLLTADPFDVVELLVIRDNLNMQGMILKDFGSDGANDGSTAFTFSNNPLWSSLASGTLIILRNNNTAADTDDSDYVLDIGMENSTYFSFSGGGAGGANNFNISNTEIVQIKSAGSGTAGVSDNIHLFMAGPTAGSRYGHAGGYKLNSSVAVSAASRYALAQNGTSSLADFDGSDAGVSPLQTFGRGNNAANSAYICNLRQALSTPLDAGGPYAVCEGNRDTLTVTPGGWAGSAAWYTGPTGGSPVFTGTSFITPPLTETATYYVSSYDPGEQCESARVPVTVDVKAVPLPVELVLFSGLHTQGNNILDWTTAVELNVSHFEIERAVDALDFEPVGMVEAVGNSTTLQHYRFADRDVPAGGLYYRLKISDLDGSSEYSEVIYLKGESATWLSDYIVAVPSPFEHQVEIRFHMPRKEAFRITVTDVLGRVLEDVSQKGVRGLNSRMLHITDPGVGSCIVRVQRADGSVLMKQMLKMSGR